MKIKELKEIINGYEDEVDVMVSGVDGEWLDLIGYYYSDQGDTLWLDVDLSANQPQPYRS